MKHLILVAHGSRRKESNDEVRELVKKMAKTDHAYDFIGEAFLELSDPLIPPAIEESIKNGAKEIIVMPYFLSEGRHVAKDVPKDVQEVVEKYPEIDIKIAPYLGKSEDIIKIIFDQANLQSGVSFEQSERRQNK